MASTIDGTAVTQIAEVELSDKQIIDKNVNGFTYIGVATRGSATSDSVWIITRLSDAAVNPQTIDHSFPEQIWDDRTSVVYS